MARVLTDEKPVAITFNGGSKKLSAKESATIEYYTNPKSETYNVWTESYKRANYSICHGWKQNAMKVLHKNYMQAAIGLKQAENKDSMELTHDRLTEDFQRLAHKSEKKLKLRTAIAAKEQIAKHIGYYEADNVQQSPQTQIGVIISPTEEIEQLKARIALLEAVPKAGTAIAGEV